jgi:hypothetical protein
MNKRDALVEVAIQVGGVVLMVVIARYLMKPDVMRTLRMKHALMVKRVADQQVLAWQNVAAKAATTYNKARV